MLFSRKSGQVFYQAHQRYVTYPASLDSPQKILTAFSIFDPRKVPSLSTHVLPFYGNSSIPTLIGQFGSDLPAKLSEGTEFEKAAIVSSTLSSEWKMYRLLLFMLK